MRNSASSLRSAASRGRRGCRRPARARPGWARSCGRAASPGHRARPASRASSVVQLDDLDAALGQLVDEVGVVALGVLDPHHVVEQQLVVVARREPAVREAGCADQHLAQPADLGVDAVRRGDGSVMSLPFLGGQMVMRPVQRPTTPMTPPATIRTNSADLGRGEQPAPVLAAGLDVEQRRRREEHGREQQELQAGGVEQEQRVRHGRARRRSSPCAARRPRPRRTPRR